MRAFSNFRDLSDPVNSVGLKHHTPTPWLTQLLLVLVKGVVTKNCVKQVKWNKLIKTTENLH